MARSVSYLNNAIHTLYINYNDLYDEDEIVDEWIAQDNWIYFKENIIDIITTKYKSLDLPIKKKWNNSETEVILENQYCMIGLSEYCGLVSLSIAVNDNYEPLALNWINKVWVKIEEMFQKAYPNSCLRKLGTFSNGEGVFEKITKEVNNEI